MATAFVVALLVALGVVNAVEFVPGCSFIGGQCMYTVQLGHQGVCDAQPVATINTGSSDTGCCSTVQSNVASLQADVATLKQQIPTLVGELNRTTWELHSTREDRDALVEMLHRREVELNNTESQYANLLAAARDEIRALRQDVTNLTSALHTCQTALGITTGETHNPVSFGGNVHMSYCSFNVLEDCGFKKLSGGSAFYLLHKGSSTLTGPRVEHSTGIMKGTYIGLNITHDVESSRSGNTLTATMESEMFEPANGYCIFFWYSMKGSDVRQLDVNVRIGGGTGYPVFSKSGDQRVDWLLGQVDLDSEYTSHPFKIDFVASHNAYSYQTYVSPSYRTVYMNEKADIGIDDVYIYNTSCSNIPKCPATAVKNTFSNNVTSCYTFHATPMTWTEAYDFCRREGPYSGLVSVETEEEQNFLVNHINNDQALSVVGQNGFYTSGSDEGNEHQFMWTDTGTPRAVNWVAGWHAGQPNNVAGNQNCLLMQYPSDGYKWGDIECDSKHPFICEVYYKD